jgi:hypothetical protein
LEILYKLCIAVILAGVGWIIFRRAVALTHSPGAAATMATFGIYYLLPFAFMVGAAIWQRKWGPPLFVLTFATAEILGGWLGYKVAKSMRKDAFTGSVIGLFAAAFLTGWPAAYMFLP